MMSLFVLSQNDHHLFHYVIVAACLGNKGAMAELAGKFDVIIDTSPQNSDVALFMGMLKFNGTYCRVG